MKKIKDKSIGLLIFLFTVSCFAGPKTPKECPDVYVLKAMGFQGAEKNPDGGWLAFHHNNHFGTENKWSFIVATAKGNNEQEAASFARFQLDDLTYGMGPEWDETNKYWICKYATYEGKIGPAVAISPPLSN